MNELDLFTAALACETTAARQALLDQHCQANLHLRQRLEELISAYRQADQVLPGVPVIDPNLTKAFADKSDSSLVGAMIAGKYKLLEEIGEGGMGTVFVAEQTEPVKRKVAVKLIKPGMDSKSVLARFDAERQALAMMDHPNIARVLDAGLTEERRPYFVMEYIKGLPLTKYCDDVRLSIEHRLQLFVQICQAVQHAHQKGVIHRDLKPGNILIALYDGKPVPKIIDFGLAKALHHSLTEHTLHTGHEMVLGTPLYMSPEQAELNNLDIDTRSDIYSLGVILYELLTGVTPLEKQRFKEAAWAEVLRIIKEEEPSKPSTKLSQSNSLPAVAAQRQMEPKKLSMLMKGDLDWIVMKALEKDRSRRYETANGFAADVMRYLSGEMVTAAPPSAGYRLRKFVKRNKGKVIAAGLVLAALVLGIIGTSIGLYEAKRQEIKANLAREAEAERAEGERVAKEDAQTSEAETKAVLEFVQNKVFAAARPKDQEGGQGYEVKLVDAMTAALPYVENSFTDQPLIEARLRMTLALSFWYLGKIDIAEQQYRRARDLFTAKLGPDHPRTLASMMGLALSYAYLGRHPEAIVLYDETLRLQKAKLGPDHPDTLMCMSNLAISYDAIGRHPEALALREETLKLQKAKLGLDHPDTLISMHNLAISYAILGRNLEALALREETLKLYKSKLGPDHPDTLTSMLSLANSYSTLGRHPEALALREETLKLYRLKLGPDHPNTLASMLNLSNSYAALGRYHEALALYEKTLKLQKEKLRVNHPYTIETIYSIACVHALMMAKAEDRSKEADLAMNWLQQAVTAGFKDVPRIKKDTDLDPLRERVDFKKLMMEIGKNSDKKCP